MLRHILKECSEIPAETRTEWEDFDRAAKRQKQIKQQQKEAAATAAAMIRRLEAESDTADECQVGDEVVNGKILKIWNEIAMMFYLANWSFSAIDLPSTRRFLKGQFSGIPLPNRHHLANLLLSGAYKWVMDTIIAKVSGKKFVAISMDGWSNPRRRGMINVMLLITGVPPMLWATKCTGDALNTGEFIAAFVIDVINDIEDQCEGIRVVSLTTDSTKNMKSAWGILEETRSGFSVQVVGPIRLSLFERCLSRHCLMATLLEMQTFWLCLFDRIPTQVSVCEVINWITRRIVSVIEGFQWQRVGIHNGTVSRTYSTMKILLNALWEMMRFYKLIAK